MRKVFVIVALLLLLVYFFPRFLQVVRQRVRRDLGVSIPQIEPTGFFKNQDMNKNAKLHESVFVPYWSLPSATMEESFERFIYFGITPSESGLATDDPGYNANSLFLRVVPDNSRKDIALRMLDASINLAILKDKKKQLPLIDRSVALAKDNNFNGIVLDLELSALPFDSLIQQINEFTKLFYLKTKEENLHFAITTYGDTFYRVRPFQIKSLQNNADEIMIMAYDFHKVGSSPGPNFPLNDNGVYGYSFSAMLKDFLHFVPAEKVTVVFGMFGHDWIIDDSGSSLGQAESLSLNAIKQRLQECNKLHCESKRDEASAETKVVYTDKSGRHHVLWYEDEESVRRKKAYAEKNGVSSFAYWAYAYY